MSQTVRFIVPAALTATRKDRHAKIAVATRTCGNVYDVTYPGRAHCDRDVSRRYLEHLVRDGYRVTIDQSSHRPEGEPASYELTLDD